MTTAPRLTEKKIQKATSKHRNATKNFYYTTIADRFRMISWTNDSLPTGVGKPFYEIPTFPLPAQQKRKGHENYNTNI